MPLTTKKKRGSGIRAIFHDIFVCARSELAPYATVFVSKPESFDQQKFGTLFGILRLDDYSESSSYVVNLLTSVMKKEYFGKAHRSPEESFEASLRKANLALAELARHGATGWAGKINFVGGALERQNLHFACLGNVSVFLVRDDHLAEISKELDEEKEAEPHPLKTFSNISSGRLEKGDKLIFATRELTDIFSSEELRQNALHFSRDEFPGFLQISLGANSELSGTVVVDIVDEIEAKKTITTIPEITKENIPKSPGAVSGDDQQARKLDSFIGAPGTNSEIFAYSEKIEVFQTETESPAPGTEKAPISSGIFWRKISSFSMHVASGAHKYAKKFSRSVYQGVSSERIKEKLRKPHLASVSQRARNVLFKFGQAVNKMRMRTRYLSGPKYSRKTGIITGATIIILILAVLIFRNGGRQEEPAPAAENLEEISQPQTLEDINVRNIENLEEVAVLPQEASRFVMLGETLYAISGKNKSVTKIGPQNKNIDDLAGNLNTENFTLITIMPDLNTLFMLTDDNKVASLTPINKNFQENSIALPANLKTADMKTYLTYVYFFDPAANQIYRYPRSEGGFGEAQNWLRAGADIKNAVSFAINDDIFAASPSEITAYLQGRKDEKNNFEKPNTPLSIDKIYSEPGMEGIYVLDNKNHRIIQYSKERKIIAQFWNADISGIKDFVVNEKNKSLYLAKENKILKFSIE